MMLVNSMAIAFAVLLFAFGLLFLLFPLAEL